MLPKNFDKRIFQLLVFLLPSQLGFHFWPEWALLYGIRIDYFAPTIFLTDVLIAFFILLNHKYFQRVPKMKVVWLLFIFFFINIFVAHSREVALLGWITLFKFLALAFLINEKKVKLKEWFLVPLAYSLVFFSLINIVQFSLQKSIGGLFYFLGERAININTVGISKVTIYGGEYLRSYGTFSHPNSLAGFFLIGLACVLFSDFPKKLMTLKWLAMGGSLISIFLSFSLSGYFGVLVLPVLYYLSKRGVKLARFYRTLVIIAVGVSLVLSVVSTNFLSAFNFEKSIKERLLLAEGARRMVSESPVFGVGFRNFIYANTKEGFVAPSLFQPVHNIFLLITSEAGMVGLLLVLYIFLNIKKQKKVDAGLLVGIFLIIFTGLFDHYWLTLQQNQLLFALILGFAFQERK